MSLYGKAIFIGVIALGASAATGTVVHRVDLASYRKLELKIERDRNDAIMAAVAEQKRLDGIAFDAAQREAIAQAQMTAKVKAQLAQVQRHVKNNRSCVTYGLVRVLDAATHGVSGDSLPLPTGKSDDACAPIDSVTLARSVVDNYGSARANAEQLNSLIATWRAMRPKTR